MRLYKRQDFLGLPSGTIYSRVDRNGGELMEGLFCKVSGGDYGNDWLEQDLIGEVGFVDGIVGGYESLLHVQNLRDTFQDFDTTLDCCGRDGCFDDDDVFVVWSKDDVKKLADYLYETLKEE